jgi:SAM-dependent methyltransferase
VGQEINEYGMVVDPERPWLGGFFPQGDPSSWCPDVWEWALDRFKIKSVIDVGCGAGKALDWFEQHGCIVLGVDGLPPNDKRIIEHDYTMGPYVPDRPFDLCWSCEFVEHVEEEYIPHYTWTFRSAKYLMMTHALWWQSGHHHVTLWRPETWIDVIEDYGFTLLGRETIESRDRALQHYWKHSGLIFRRTK